MKAEFFDAVVVGGGPAGATAAADLARSGHAVLLLDRAGRIKPCGGGMPPQLLRDFEVPEILLASRATAVRLVAPSERWTDLHVENGYLGLVDRASFDEWLRFRAEHVGAVRRAGVFQRLDYGTDGTVSVHYLAANGAITSARARAIVGADGANSAVARQALPDLARPPKVFAYHEIIETPAALMDRQRCDFYYQGHLSPDFYGWVFPHGKTMSVGSVSARKGFALRPAVEALRATAGLVGPKTIRREGAPLPIRLLKRWDDGRRIVLAGDAAGTVAPVSGEGLYYAMASGRLAAEAVETFLRSGDTRALASARSNFVAAHGMVFKALGLIQALLYGTDSRRETYVAIHRDPDVQRMVLMAFLNKGGAQFQLGALARIVYKSLLHRIMH